MKTRILSGLLAVCLTPVVAMATIDGVSVNPSPSKVGEEVFITLTGDARQSRCGLSVEFGDGEVRDIKIDAKEGLFPRTLTKTYAKPGAYAIAVTGKSIFRGFNSYSPCEGKGMTAVTVASGDSVPLLVKPPNELLPAKSFADSPILRIEPGEHTAPIRRIATDDQGRWLATASIDKTVRLWSLADGRLLTTIRPPLENMETDGKLFAVALSPDGATVAAAGFTKSNQGTDTTAQKDFSIYMFERGSGRMLRRISGLPSFIYHLAFSPDGLWLAATLGGKNGVRVFAAADGQLLSEDRDYGDQSTSAHFSGNGQIVTTSYDGLLRLYRFDGKHLTLLVKCAAPGGKQPYAARFSPNGQLIAVGFNDTTAVNVLNSDSLTLRFAPDTVGVNAGLVSIAWSRDGAILFAAGYAGHGDQDYIRRWAGGGAGIPSDWPVTGDTIIDLAPLPGGRLAFGSGDPAWGVVDEAGRKILFHTPVVADFRGNIENFKLSSDGAQIQFDYKGDGKSIAIFDSVRRVFLPTSTLNLTTPMLGAYGITVTGWENATNPKLNGAPLTLATREFSRSLALWPNGEGFVLGTEWMLRAYARSGELRWKQPAPSPVWGANISADSRWVVAAYGDGTIRWHRASDGAEQLAFYPHPDKKRWVLWTPSGYYDASPGAEDLIGWHLNRGKDQAADFFPASRFRKNFYRPDVIARILETVDEAKALQLANQETGRDVQAVSIVQALPPVVEILSPQSGFGASSTDLTVKVAIRSPEDAPTTATRVRVNGLLQTGSRNLQVKAADDVREITVTLPQQDAEIQIFAENKNGVSTPATLHVSWAGKKVVPAQEDNRFKPKLYVLAVGVSKYQNKDYNLDLAAKDARDFAAVFQKQKGKLYGEVAVRLLTDDKATKDGVLDGLEWLKREVTSRDVGVMFLAGHGMNDNTGNYYFLPHNVDINQLVRTGVGENDIKITLNALAGKAIFFVDSCHSGNALGTAKTRGIADVNAFVSELASTENGVIVFTASTGRQLSQESPEWGNGVFTKAVVEGLGGKADFQKNGKITHKGLDYYVTERVKELTKGQQSPVSIAPGGITDFPIAFAVGKR